MNYQPDIAVFVPARPSVEPRRSQLPERVQAILRETAHDHGLEVGDILGQSRKRCVARARQDAAWRLKNMAWGAEGGWSDGKPSFPQVGRWMGLDHTTILHACRGHDRREIAPMRTVAAIYQGGWA